MLLVASAAAIGAAPLVMPEGYSIVSRSVSESAAQNLNGAWLARSGLMMLGFAVLILSSVAGGRWGLAGRSIFRLYGAGVIATAVFSHMPWQAVPYDVFEDALHSWASGLVGFSFIVGVVSVGVQRGPASAPARIFDAVTVTVAIGVSFFIFATPDIAGAIQRIMFAVAYIWFGLEASRIGRAVDPVEPIAAPAPAGR